MRETVSQRWESRRKNVQQALEANIQALGPQLEACNRELAKGALRLSSDDAVFTSFKHTLTQEIDQGWHFGDTQLLVTGRWQKTHLGAPRLEEDALILPTERRAEPAHEVAISKGFVVISDPERQDVFCMSHLFAPKEGRAMYGVHGLDTGYVDLNYQPYATALPQDITLGYYGSGVAQETADVREIAGVLESVDEKLRSRLSSNASSFFRQSANQQQAYFQQLIDRAYATVPSLSSGFALVTNIAAHDVYIADPATGLPKQDESAGSNIELVSGKVQDFTIFETWQSVRERREYRALRNTQDMYTPTIGMCVSLITDEKVCYIPVSDAQSISFFLEAI